MSTTKIITLAILSAIFILLVALDGRRKLKKKHMQSESDNAEEKSVPE